MCSHARCSTSSGVGTFVAYQEWQVFSASILFAKKGICHLGGPSRHHIICLYWSIRGGHCQCRHAWIADTEVVIDLVDDDLDSNRNSDRRGFLGYAVSVSLGGLLLVTAAMMVLGRVTWACRGPARGRRVCSYAPAQADVGP